MQLSKETSLFKKDSIADDINGLRTDVDGAIKTTVPVYYRSTTHSTPSIDDSTSIGTSPTTNNAWEYVMPYPERNCYFYTCEQYTAVDGTKSYSIVRELNSETYTSKWVSSSDATYIDGGMLYTGSVTANKIAANAVTIGKLGSDVTDAIDDAEKTATNYITEIGNDGIRVHDANTSNNSVVINSSGMEVFKGGTASANSVAFYGDTARVGRESGGHVNTTGTGVELYYDDLKLGTFQQYGTSNAGLLRVYGVNGGYAQLSSGALRIEDSSTQNGMYTSTSIRLLSSSDDRNVRLAIVGNGQGGYNRELYITAPDGVDISNNLVVNGTIKSSGGLVPTRNQMCYANSRVDNFVDGQITLSLESLGITTGAKPVGILLTYQDGGATPTILRYDYDASSASGVVIKAYNSSGGAVSGNVRYFALVFQNSWTSVT